MGRSFVSSSQSQTSTSQSAPKESQQANQHASYCKYGRTASPVVLAISTRPSAFVPQKVTMLLVSLAVSCHAGSRYYSKPPPPVVVHRVAPPTVIHSIPAPLPVLPAPLPVPEPVVALPLAAAPVPIITAPAASQFHAQDELGQATFGYSHPGQAAVNHRDANGNMFGSWSYINPEGKEVRTSYVADALGFRVVSNDLPVAPLAPAHLPASAALAPLPLLPQPALPVVPVPVGGALPVGPAPVLLDTPEVMEAKRQHLAAHAEAKARNALLTRHRRGAGYGHSYERKSYKKPAPVVFRHEVPILAPAPAVVEVLPAPQPLAVLPHSLPVVQAAPAIQAVPAPLVLAAPVAGPTVSKFHSQDELGQAAFGFTTPDQSQSNFRDIHGNQVGHYSYINPEGQEIIVHYTAGRDGFRVLSNALPVAPAGVVFQDAPALPIAFSAPAPVPLPAALPIAHGPVLDTPEVMEAKRQHFAAHAEALIRNQGV